MTAQHSSLDRKDWPVHHPIAPEAPIPGVHWHSGCDPDRPRVDPSTGRCGGCGGTACRECGREDCPDHPAWPEYALGMVENSDPDESGYYDRTSEEARGL